MLEQAIIKDASGNGLMKSVSPGELLMLLQHHSAPTRLLDVSVKPLEALYFAVEKADSVDARLFSIWLKSDITLKLSGRSDLPWSENVRGQNATAAWTQTVSLVDERPLDPRMIAQEGRFLVGGLHRAYNNLNMWHKDQLRVAERQAISMLCINFPRVSESRMHGTNWPALAWTIRIPAAWKPELRSRLVARGISHDSMYPDMGSIQWKAERAARNWADC